MKLAAALPVPVLLVPGAPVRLNIVVCLGKEVWCRVGDDEPNIRRLSSVTKKWPLCHFFFSRVQHRSRPVQHEAIYSNKFGII